MKNIKSKDKKSKSLFAPLFTFFFYSHSPDVYDKIRNNYCDRLKEPSHDNSSRLKKWLDSYINQELEREFPTPIWWNNIAGFIPIRVQKRAEGYRVVGEVWAIKNRKFKRARVFYRQYSIRDNIRNSLISDPQKFNEKFFFTVEDILKQINRNFLKKKKFYFSLEDNRLNWDLMKTANVAKFLNDLGPHWLS